MNKRSKRIVSLCAMCLVLAVLKLWLISGEEIIARFQPLDDLWQIMAASRGYWFAEKYDWMTYVRLPVYPIWLAFVYFSGLPLRIGIELLFIIASFLFLLSLIRAKVPTPVAAIIFISIIFHPASFSLFNYALAETLYAPVLLISLACIVNMWIDRQTPKLKRHALITGIWLSILWHTRPEGELIIALLFGLAFAACFLLWLEKKPRQKITQFLLTATLLPCAMILISSLMLKSANWLKTGLFVSTEMSSPGYLAANKALLRIKPDKSIRFIPVTKEVREKAYSASPSFKELQPLLEGENFGKLETQRSMGIQGEIAAGWFYWVLRQSAATAGHGNSAEEINSFFEKIAMEINSAIDQGKLPGRFVWSTFIDPNPSNYLPYLGGSLIKMFKVFVSTSEPQKETDDIANASTRRAFDIIANRRTALTTNGPTLISGWVFSEKSPIERLSIKDMNGITLVSTENFSGRPDVTKGFQASGVETVSDNIGFTLTATTQGSIGNSTLVIETSNGASSQIGFSQIPIGRVTQTLDDSNNKITFAIDAASQQKTTHALDKIAKQFIWNTYGRILSVMGYVGLIAFFSLILCHRFAALLEDVNLILGLLLIVILSRTSLFALLDASSWPGDQIRYLFPAMQLYGAFLILLIYSSVVALKARIAKKSA